MTPKQSKSLFTPEILRPALIGSLRKLDRGCSCATR